MSLTDARIQVQRLPDLDTWELYEIKTGDGRQAGIVGLRFHPDSMQIEYAVWGSSDDEVPRFVRTLELDATQLREPGYAAVCIQRAAGELLFPDGFTTV